MTESTKVLLEIKGSKVFMQELTTIDGAPALNPRGVFSELGHVNELRVPGKKPGTFTKVWQWSCDGYKGESTTKAGAIRAMLADCGYEAVPLTATMPDLLEGLLT